MSFKESKQKNPLEQPLLSGEEYSDDQNTEETKQVWGYDIARENHDKIVNALNNEELSGNQKEALKKLQALLLYYNNLYVSSWGLTKATTYMRDWHDRELQRVETTLQRIIDNNALESVKVWPSFSDRFFKTFIDPDLSWISVDPKHFEIREFAWVNWLEQEPEGKIAAFFKGSLYYSVITLELLFLKLAQFIASGLAVACRVVAKSLVTLAQFVLGVGATLCLYIPYKHFWPETNEVSEAEYRILRNLYKPWDRVLALKKEAKIDVTLLEKFIEDYKQLLKRSTTAELSAVHQLKIDALNQFKALLTDPDAAIANATILDAIARFMQTGDAGDGAPEAIKQIVENYAHAEQEKKNALRAGFSEITKHYQHKLFHDVAVNVLFKQPEQNEEKYKEEFEAKEDFQVVAYQNTLGVWMYRTISSGGVVSKPQFVRLLEGGDQLVAELNDDNDNLAQMKEAISRKNAAPKQTLNVILEEGKWKYILNHPSGDYGKAVSGNIEDLTGGSDLIPYLVKGNEGKLTPSQIAILERNIRQVVMSHQETTWHYFRSYVRYLSSDDHYQGKTVRGSTPLVRSAWEKDNLDFIKLIDTLAQMDTDGRYVDQVAQIINDEAAFDKSRQELLSKTLDSIFLDMQVKRYSNINASDNEFFAKLDKRFASEYATEEGFQELIRAKFYEMANQPATTEGNERASALAEGIAIAYVGKSAETLLTRKKIIHAFLAERDRVHAQKATIQAELKRYKVREHRFLEQLGIARHISSKNTVNQCFYGHTVKYVYDTNGTLYIPEDKQVTRGWKSTLLLLGLFVGIIVGLGEGVVAAFAMMSVMMLIVPIIFLGGALCNYFLMKGDTYAVLLDWFTKVEVTDESGHTRLVRKLWVDGDGKEVGAKAYLMAFFGLAALGTGVVYGCLQANCILGLFGLSISGLISLFASGNVALALLGFVGVFLPAISTAIAIMSIYFIVIANFVKLGGLSIAWAALKKAFGNDEIGKSFGESTWENPLGFFTWERVVYTLISIVAEVPRIALALALSAITILVGFILFKGNSTALLQAFGVGAGVAEGAGYAFAGMNTASNVVFAFKKILAMIDLVWKKSFIQPLAYLVLSLFTIWATNEFQQKMFGVVDAYVNSGHLAKEHPISQPALELLKLVVGLPVKLLFAIPTFLLSWAFDKTAVMLISQVSSFVDWVIENAWYGAKFVILQPAFKIIALVMSGLYWLCSFGQKNRVVASLKAVDDLLGINQPKESDAAQLKELANPIQSRSSAVLQVKWWTLTVGTLFNSTGQAFLMGDSIPKIPEFMKNIPGMPPMPSNMVLSVAIYPSMWVFSFGPNYIAYDGVIEGSKIPGIEDAYFTVTLIQDEEGQLHYQTILHGGKRLEARSIDDLGSEAAAIIKLAYADGTVTEEARNLVVNAAAKQAQERQNNKAETPSALSEFAKSTQRPGFFKGDVVMRKPVDPDADWVAPSAFPALGAAAA